MKVLFFFFTSFAELAFSYASNDVFLYLYNLSIFSPSLETGASAPKLNEICDGKKPELI